MLYIVGGPGSLSHILRIMGRGWGEGGGALYSWRTGVLVPFLRIMGRGVVLYIVGGQGSLSHF